MQGNKTLGTYTDTMITNNYLPNNQGSVSIRRIQNKIFVQVKLHNHPLTHTHTSTPSHFPHTQHSLDECVSQLSSRIGAARERAVRRNEMCRISILTQRRTVSEHLDSLQHTNHYQLWIQHNYCIIIDGKIAVEINNLHLCIHHRNHCFIIITINHKLNKS